MLLNIVFHLLLNDISTMENNNSLEFSENTEYSELGQDLPVPSILDTRETDSWTNFDVRSVVPFAIWKRKTRKRITTDTDKRGFVVKLFFISGWNKQNSFLLNKFCLSRHPFHTFKTFPLSSKVFLHGNPINFNP